MKRYLKILWDSLIEARMEAAKARANFYRL
jgi:hypothetical protein